MERLFVIEGRLRVPSNYIFLVNTWRDFSEGLFVVGEALRVPSSYIFLVNTFAIGGRRTIAKGAQRQGVPKYVPHLKLRYLGV